MHRVEGLITSKAEMFGKKRHADEDQSPSKRLASNLRDLYGSGQINSERMATLLRDAADGGNDSCYYHSMRRAGEKGLRARALNNAMMKDSSWPPLLVHKITFKGPDDTEAKEDVAFLLMHEVLWRLWEQSSPQCLASSQALDEVASVKAMQLKHDWKATHFIPLSFWGDGVPVSWDRGESIECFTWALPGLADEAHRAVRFPFCVVPKEMCCQATYDEIFKVARWCLTALSIGRWPEQLPDGEPFQEPMRKKMAAQPLGFQAGVVQFKGDWEFFGNVLHLPRWDNKAGVCWLCQAHKDDIQHSGLDAKWRDSSKRIPPDQLLQFMVAQKRPISPVWGWPGMDGSCFRIDWLHVADQGVTANFFGSLLVLVVAEPGLSSLGTTQDARRLAVWRQIEAFYKASHVSSDRLPALHAKRFRTKPPSLKAPAGTVRQLVPFFKAFVAPWSADTMNAEFMAVKAAMDALYECYQCLSQSGPELQHLKEQSAMFGLQVVALHQAHPDKYALKPKLHLFLELCSLGVRPAVTWNYREEDFGGALAAMSHRAGGRKTPLAVSRTCLQRFCIRAPPPNFVAQGGESSSMGASSSTGS